MTEARLAGLLRAAWKCVRLDAIRAAVEQTILKLEALEVGQVLDSEPAPGDLDAATGPVRSALDACCDELRDGCGLSMQHAGTGHANDDLRAGDDASWQQRRAAALQGYRAVAFSTLEAVLGPLSP